MTDSDQLCIGMKDALLYWFNIFGKSEQLEDAATLKDLAPSHIPALLKYLRRRSHCERTECTSSIFQESLDFFMTKPDIAAMAAELDAAGAVRGEELAIAKFLLLFWQDLCISDHKAVEESLQWIKQNSDQHHQHLANALKWMSDCVSDEDAGASSDWWHILLASHGVDLDSTPTNNEAMDTDSPLSAPRPGETTFICRTPAGAPNVFRTPAARAGYRHTLMPGDLAQTPRNVVARRAMPSTAPRQSSPIADQLYSPGMREMRSKRELETMRAGLNKANAYNDILEDNNRRLVSKLEDETKTNVDLREKVRQLTEDLRMERRHVESRDSEIADLQRERGALQKNLESKSEAHARYKELYAAVERDMIPLKKNITDLDEKCDALRKRNADLKDEYAATKEKLHHKEVQMEEARKQILESAREVEELRADFESARCQAQEEKQKMENVAMEAAQEAHERISALIGEQRQRDEIIATLTQQLASFEEREGAGKRRREEATKETAALNDALHAAQLQLIQIKSRATVLEGERDEARGKEALLVQKRDAAAALAASREEAIGVLEEALAKQREENQSAKESTMAAMQEHSRLSTRITDLTREAQEAKDKLKEEEWKHLQTQVDLREARSALVAQSRSAEEKERALSEDHAAKVHQLQAEMLDNVAKVEMQLAAATEQHSATLQQLQGQEKEGAALREEVVAWKEKTANVEEEKERIVEGCEAAMAAIRLDLTSIADDKAAISAQLEALTLKANQELAAKMALEEELAALKAALAVALVPAPVAPVPKPVAEALLPPPLSARLSLASRSSLSLAGGRRLGPMPDLDIEDEPDQLYGKSLLGASYDHTVCGRTSTARMVPMTPMGGGEITPRTSLAPGMISLSSFTANYDKENAPMVNYKSNVFRKPDLKRSAVSLISRSSLASSNESLAVPKKEVTFSASSTSSTAAKKPRRFSLLRSMKNL